MRSLRITATLLVAVLVSCINPFAPAPIPSNTWVQFAPLSGYPAEFERMRSCTSAWSGVAYSDSMSGDVQHFYMVQRGDIRTNGIRAAALTWHDSSGVNIAIVEYLIRDKDVVRHEFIHALQNKHPELVVNGNWHPLALFDYCGVPTAIAG